MAISTMNKRRALVGTFFDYCKHYHEISYFVDTLLRIYLSAYYCTSAGDMVTCSRPGLAHGPVSAAVTLLNLSLATRRGPASCPHRPADLGDLAAFCPEIEMY